MGFGEVCVAGFLFEAEGGLLLSDVAGRGCEMVDGPANWRHVIEL